MSDVLICVVIILTRLAYYDHLAGSTQSALSHCYTAINLAKQAGYSSMQCMVLHSLSQKQHALGKYHLSLLTAQQGWLVAKSTGDLYREA